MTFLQKARFAALACVFVTGPEFRRAALFGTRGARPLRSSRLAIRNFRPGRYRHILLANSLTLTPPFHRKIKTAVRGRTGPLWWAVQLSTISSVNPDAISVGIKHYGRPAIGQIERFDREPYIVFSQMLNCLVKILDLENELRPLWRGLQKRFVSDPQSVRTDFVFDPELFVLFDTHSGSQTEDFLVECTTPFPIRCRIGDKRKFNYLHLRDSFPA